MNWDYIAGYFDGEGNVWVGGPDSGGSKVSLNWFNTHRESLEMMQSFMGCGRIRSQPRQASHHKPSYVLSVADRESLLRVINELVARCIIKRDALVRAQVAAEKIHPLADGWGNLAALGAEEVERLYNDGMTQAEIGEMVGVTGSAVKNFMIRHGIATRRRGVESGTRQKRFRHVDMEEVHRLYHEEGLSQQKIAERFGCRQTTVSLWLRNKFA